MALKRLEMPKKLEIEKETFTETYGKFFAEPFERGYATTVGNAVRRVLLSSIQGAAITAVKVEGVLHEFATMPGVVEDMTEIILNLKEVKLKLHGEGPKRLYLTASGERKVTAKDLTPDDEVEVVSAGQQIATLSGKLSKLDMEVEVNQGRGYHTAERNRREDLPEGFIPIDAIFTPVTKVAVHVENIRVGQMTDYERLVVEVWTDGRIRPDDALSYAAQILRDHLAVFIGIEEQPYAETEERVDESTERLQGMLTKSVEELELSVRAANCLKVANIRSLSDLVQKSEAEMLKYRNFGRKSLNEIRDILAGMGLSFGMKLDPKVVESLSADSGRAKTPARA